MPGHGIEARNDDVAVFRERIVQCLIMGKYTLGGSFVLETLILYLVIELFMSKDADIGVSLLLGNIVKISMGMGYHRDPTHFPKITPFASEMQRRIWATVSQIEFIVSIQMGLPRMIMKKQTDTGEPRNLADSDFDEQTAQLPPSRPETEMTPILYVIAKCRLLSAGADITDLITETNQHPYSRVLGVHKILEAARDSLPTMLRWHSLARSLTLAPQVIMQQIWLEIWFHHLQIILHRSFLDPSRNRDQYTFSTTVCLEAAAKILEF